MMKSNNVVRIFATVFILSLILNLFPVLLVVHPVYAIDINPTSATVGSVIAVSDFTAGQTYSIKFDGYEVEDGIFPDTSSYVTFVVPEAIGGSHTIVIEVEGTQVYSNDTFMVIPSIEVDDTEGIVGSEITISGSGFALSETSIKILWDDGGIKSGISASTKGSWEASFSVPATTSGSHSIDASGSHTGQTDVDNITFTVIPSISISPVSGGVGTTITVKGTGFAEEESGIKVLYDETEVKTSIVASDAGSWSTTFNVPSSPAGIHSVDAYGLVTAASDVPDVSYTVAPNIAMDKTSGTVDTTVNIIGSGFSANETSIDVLFDGTVKLSNLKADANGLWGASLKIPAAGFGAHSIDARGSITTAAKVMEVTFNIVTQMIISPTSGNVGDTINISGNGFSPSAKLDITYADTLVLSGISIDQDGSFYGSFTAPGGRSGEISVTATDSEGATQSSVFSMETTPPKVPQLISPSNGARVGYIGDTRVTFTWADVLDPSGVSYELQLSAYPNFNANIIEAAGLTTTVYKLAEADALPKGEYYWRVRATDGAGNTSDWTTAHQIKTAFLTWTMAAIIGGGFVLFIIVLAVLLRR